jgi:alpha,alpha-trehalose phosphorylase
VILQDSFTVEPWNLRETHLDLDLLAQTESVFALANGHLGWRANLDEGEPHGLPGTYLNGVYEPRPRPAGESAYGQPESGQEVINVTNGKLIRLFVDDEPFDVRYGRLRSHERVLDFRAGVLSRRAEWVSPAGRSVRVSSERLVSFTQRAVAAISYEVEPLDGRSHIAVQSELMPNEQLPQASADPRVASALESPLNHEGHAARGSAVLLVHKTKRSGLRVGAAMDHLVQCAANVQVDSQAFETGGLVSMTTVLEPGQKLRLIKLVTYGWSGERSLPAIRDQVWAALRAARQSGWDGLLAEQRAYLDDFWDRADVEIDGDAEVQQAVRFALFHVLQAGARAESRAIPAKGLTGPGYDGHTFWDTETFVLPMLSLTAPDAAANALQWRQSTLPLALGRAAQLGLQGAAFPWRTIAGQECSAYWPGGTAAFHVNADIAVAGLHHIDATGDQEFARDTGMDLVTATARLWRSLGHHHEGRFHIDGVTGPDEYSAIADDNVYTNLMARRNLLAAAEMAKQYPDRARELGVTDEESAGWRDAAEDMYLPYDQILGVHAQAEGFTRHQTWDFAHTTPARYPLMLHFPYFDLYRKQVVKQADLVLAMYLCGDAFTPEQKARNFDYYEALTVRDSSLSAAPQAVIAAETGHLGLAFDYLGEAAMMDLRDLEHNTRDGVHIASLASTWVALVSGFGGLRHASDGTFTFAPRLPCSLARLAFTLTIGGRRLRVAITRAQARYTLEDGEPLQIFHYGHTLRLTPGQPRTRRIPVAPARPEPSQPSGREPAHRRPADTAT